MLGPRPEIDPRSAGSGLQAYRDGVAAQAPQGGWKGQQIDHQLHNNDQPRTLKPTLPACTLGMRMCCLGAMWTGLWPYLCRAG
eukprot:8578017-Karenia_brevis.AAC.1